MGAAGDSGSVSKDDPADLTETKKAVIAALRRFATPNNGNGDGDPHN